MRMADDGELLLARFCRAAQNFYEAASPRFIESICIAILL